MRTHFLYLSVLLGLLAVAACETSESEPGDAVPDDPVLQAVRCGVISDEVIPGDFGWDVSLAVEESGVVHVAGSSAHAVRGVDGGWQLEESSFGAPYWYSPLLAAGPQGLVVAHVGDGMRVARAQGDTWVSLLDRPQVQCSGSPYIEDLEVGADGRILVQGSEGPLLFAPDGTLEELESGGELALDVGGTLRWNGSDPMVLEDRFGTHELEGSDFYVQGAGSTARGEVAVLVQREEPQGLIAHLRDAEGAWTTVELVGWSDDECPEDPTIGDVCTGSYTNIERATVATAGELTAVVVLRETTFELAWRCWPTVGNTGGCYHGWEGDRTDRHQVLIGAPSAERSRMVPLDVPEPGEDDPAPVVVVDGEGDRHVLVGDRYLRVGCEG